MKCLIGQSSLLCIRQGGRGWEDSEEKEMHLNLTACALATGTFRMAFLPPEG